ncbi:ClpXP protease specificity-enhancing factor [Vibrio sp. Isolate25]|uniref:ClpXP protease specificity-enhancing factor n=1 Tax=Vibrio TaxID=662 RepID=UPI001EFD321A|nr:MULTISPECIES: ClpXP protease specificity-enhancing factor [Vibrio]MCG9596526.1 ClpXP protease specificity-enhancing factor [Vibrio sp. Isolate25]MCG9678130.1 ClpXP protease specificity-enhancing factor [Vibrio sp. Isolate24]USD32006.1 ClpXP protease specificity-enhancing factor [Vibrio sp. SCSIO 43186]USD45048.1 ClpXP protease specificity-enhancing factor [Vibrio sp. SCSIO 43145]USD69129.1 ClpXP protease specificity-enhancing factor [Vibrio sp. SCSIO 43139]
MDITNMTPRRPYMLRAFYDWLVDNDLTPHLVVEATLPGVRVPVEFVQDGQIILNIAPRAVGNLELGNEAITFSARFSGRPHSVIVPLYAVQAIYARENGAGTMFEPEEAYMDDFDGGTSGVEEFSEEDSGLSLATEAFEEEPTPDDEPPRPKGRPSLRVIK